MNTKPQYNPRIHHRRSIRLKGYDYSREGLYFVLLQFVVMTGFVILDIFQIIPNHIHAIISLTEPAAVGATLAVALIGDTVAPIGDTVAPDFIGAWVNPARTGTVAPDFIGAGVNPAPTGTGTGVSDIVGAYKSLVTNNHTNALLHI